MLFLLSSLVRVLTRLLVLAHTDADTKDLEILVLRHQLRVLRRKTGRPRFTTLDRVLLATTSRLLPKEASRPTPTRPGLLSWHATLPGPPGSTSDDRFPAARPRRQVHPFLR